MTTITVDIAGVAGEDRVKTVVGVLPSKVVDLAGQVTEPHFVLVRRRDLCLLVALVGNYIPWGGLTQMLVVFAWCELLS